MLEQQVKYYFTTGRFKSKNLDLPDGDSKQIKFFEAGKMVMGKEQPIVTGETAVITPDGYPLPVDKIKEITDQSAIANLQKAGERVQNIVNRNFIKDTVRANQYSVNGAVYGAMAGVAFGWIFRKPVMWCGFIGMLAGGFTGYGISKINMKK